MPLSTPQDISVTIIVPSEPAPKTSTSAAAAAAPSQNPPLIRTERRITPSWTISQLKAKLEPITGVPVSSQSLRTFDPTTQAAIPLQRDADTLDNPLYHLHKNAVIEVVDTRPPGARANFTDVSGVEKYEMPKDRYEGLDDSVLAWKRRQKLGRFDPEARSPEEVAGERRRKDGREVERRGIGVGKRCRVGGEDARRGEVLFVGEIEGLGGERERGCVWVGVRLDEPVGRNDGSVTVQKVVVGEDGKTEETKPVVQRVFECPDRFGVFARPEKIEAGDFPPLDDLGVDEDMEEI